MFLNQYFRCAAKFKRKNTQTTNQSDVGHWEKFGIRPAIRYNLRRLRTFRNRNPTRTRVIASVLAAALPCWIPRSFNQPLENGLLHVQTVFGLIENGLGVGF